jgi:hypothetical protein
VKYEVLEREMRQSFQNEYDVGNSETPENTFAIYGAIPPPKKTEI